MALDISQKQFSVGDTTGCNRKYWQPIKLDNYSNDQYFWSGDTHEDVENYINNLNWMNSMPNAYGTEECLDITEISGNYYANDVEKEEKAARRQRIITVHHTCTPPVECCVHIEQV